VEIVHDLAFRLRFLQGLAEPIIGGFFVEPIANRTLAKFKELLEPHTAGERSEDEQQP
jgi:hypothetical protein